MARTKRTQKSKADSINMVPAKFQVMTNENTPTYYANYIEVLHTPYEFSMIFAKVPTKLKQEEFELAKKNQRIQIEPILQIDIPTIIIPGLIKALTIQKEKYEKTIGQIMIPKQ